MSSQAKPILPTYDMHNTEPYPIDVNGLSKGSVVPAAQVEAIVGLPQAHANYSLKSVELATYIMREMRERGDPATVIQDHGALRVLTDEEASEYQARQFSRSMARMFRSHGRMCEVDQSNLSAAVLHKHEQRVVVQGRLLQAIRQERRAIQASPTRPDDGPRMIVD